MPTHVKFSIVPGVHSLALEKQLAEIPRFLKSTLLRDLFHVCGALPEHQSRLSNLPAVNGLAQRAAECSPENPREIIRIASKRRRHVSGVNTSREMFRNKLIRPTGQGIVLERSGK